MEQVLSHDAFYAHQKKEAESSLAHICGWTAPKCRDSVRDCVMAVLGLSLEEAETLFNAIEWLQAESELKEHK